jgi:rubrerythrin
MSHELTLENLDRDGAITEAIADVYGDTRAGFLRKAVFGGGAMAAALAVPSVAVARKRSVDRTILNFDLVFEYLQSTFYTETEKMGTIRKMPDRKARWARVLGAHERAHVDILKQVLGKQAVKKPFFDFGGVTESEDGFTKTAVAMEDLTVALLAGQAARLENREITAAVFSLLTVEARHAAWARRIVKSPPVNAAFDRPKSLRQVDRLVNETNFTRTRPILIARRRPRFTG